MLRFHAGTVDGPNGPEEVEHAAVIDLQTNAVVSVEVQRQGEQGRAVDVGTTASSWSPAADGITDEFQLRQGKPPPPPPVVARQGDRNPYGGRKPKTLFDLLFGLY